MKLEVGKVYRVMRGGALCVSPFLGCLVRVEKLGHEPEERGWEKGKGEKWAWARRLDSGEAQWFYENELREVSAIDALAEIVRPGRTKA